MSSVPCVHASKARRTVSRLRSSCWPCPTIRSGHQYVVWGDRYATDGLFGGVEDGVADRCRNPVGPDLADALSPQHTDAGVGNS
jgi:hypothetical protein